MKVGNGMGSGFGVSNRHALVQRAGRLALWVFSAAVLLFLLGPILVIMPLSFSSGSFFYYPLPGLSLRWYADFFTSGNWLPTLWNSLIVGVASTLTGHGAGHAGGLRLLAHALPGPGLLVCAAAVADGGAGGHRRGGRVLCVRTGGPGQQPARPDPGAHRARRALCAGHGQRGARRLRRQPDARAAANLGAPPLQAFFRVALPTLAPGIVSGALFAFATSFDEVVVAIAADRARAAHAASGRCSRAFNDNISLTITARGHAADRAGRLLLLLCLEWLRRRGARLRGVAA